MFLSLLPKRIDNLLVAGRSISSTHEAHSAIRIMPICTNVGEGAGIAATLALKNNLCFRDINVNEVQEELLKHGGIY